MIIENFELGITTNLLDLDKSFIVFFFPLKIVLQFLFDTNFLGIVGRVFQLKITIIDECLKEDVVSIELNLNRC